MANQVNSDHEGDGVDRRGFLKCMAWAGTGLVWSVGGGVLSSRAFGQDGRAGGGGQLLVRPDQRQPHRVRQGPVQEDRDRHAPGGRGQDQCAAATARLPDPHRRPHPPVDPRGVRHRRRDPQGGQGRQDLLRARRARCHRRRVGIPRSGSARGPGARAGTASTTAGSTSSAWSTSRARAPTRGSGILGDEQLDWLKADVAGLAASTPIVVFGHVPLVGGLPAVGLGYAGRRAGAGLPQAVRLGHRAQRPHPPDRPEGRREHDFPHGSLDRRSPSRSRARRPPRAR